MIGKYLERKPKISETAFVAPGALVLGAVELGKYCSIWFGVVARADINKISIGSYSNIQDGSVIHVDDEQGVHIGHYVTVGNGAILHACRIKEYCLIGMGAIILNNAEVGEGALVAAGSVVCEKYKVPEGTLAMGAPAKIVRDLTKTERDEHIYWAKKYARLSQEYKGSSLVLR